MVAGVTLIPSDPLRMVADLMALFTGFEVNFQTESPFVPNPALSETIWTGKQYVTEVGFF